MPWISVLALSLPLSLGLSLPICTMNAVEIHSLPYSRTMAPWPLGHRTALGVPEGPCAKLASGIGARGVGQGGRPGFRPGCVCKH